MQFGNGAQAYNEACVMSVLFLMIKRKGEYVYD